ncbi:MAG: response regulator [Deltaproteobacteria bacterium]|nr:response regulator [Deltaproteobacteria bacterium]
MKILAVDNQPGMLKSYVKILGKHGYEIETAKDGLLALEILKSFTPDLILLDFTMPNIDGEKFCKIVRDTPELDHTVVIFIADAAVEEGLDFSKYGADGCIPKGPFDIMKNDIIEVIRSKRHSDIILNNMSDGIVELTENYIIVNANPAALKLTGRVEGKLLGSNFVDLFPKKIQKLVIRQLENDHKNTETMYARSSFELNGHQFLLNILPVSDFDEQSIIVILRDITARKEVEEQLYHAQKMEAIGTLAGGIAHDFNNLLMGIQGNVSVLLLDVNYTHPHYAHLKKIEDITKNASKLTNQLLGYARKGKYEIKTMDFNQVVMESSEIFGRTRKQIEIKRKLAKDLSAIDADRLQIEQVLLNLYANAWQAMPAGGTLTLMSENVTHRAIKSKLYKPKPGNYIRLKVTDTGIGMDEKTKKRIYHPFFTTKDIGRGTGLGLASAYGIIKNHGGYIEVESELGRGTTFMLFFPSSSEVFAEKEEKFDIHTEPESILFIDDEDMILDTGEKMLRILGYNVLTARGGKEGLKIYKSYREKIDLVILDMVMPDMNGEEVYSRLKDINQNVKILIASGYGPEGLPKELNIREGVNFIQKPFDLRHLFKATRKMLDNEG